jgi:hypothetical protein
MTSVSGTLTMPSYRGILAECKEAIDLPLDSEQAQTF